MRHRIPRTGLAPDGFSVDEVKVVADSVQIHLRSRHSSRACPDCARVSRRVQSRYVRRPADLPLSGRRVQLLIVARRFWCDAVLCGRRIFC
ncbi:transposase family protein [Roseibium sp. M-1]